VRGRSVAAKAPRSGIGRFMGAWIVSRLQKSVRSISSAVHLRDGESRSANATDDKPDAASSS
jgi:hypothetical protein